MITVTAPDRPRIDTGPRLRWLHTAWLRLHEPAVLAIVAGVFFISAVGQSVVQAYIDDRSVVTTTVLSVFGSLFLAAAIIVAARRHEQATKTRRPPGDDAR